MTLIRDWNTLMVLSYQDDDYTSKLKSVSAGSSQPLPAELSSVDIPSNPDSNIVNHEHRGYDGLPTFSSLKVLNERVGSVAKSYFGFGNIVLAVNLFLSVCAFCFYVIHFRSLIHNYPDLQISSIFSSLTAPFLWTSVVYMEDDVIICWWFLIVITFISCGCYPLIYRYWILRQNKIEDANNQKHFDTNSKDDPARGQMGRARGIRHQALDSIETQTETIWSIYLHRIFGKKPNLTVEETKTLEMTNIKNLIMPPTNTTPLDQNVNHNRITIDVIKLDANKTDINEANEEAHSDNFVDTLPPQTITNESNIEMKNRMKGITKSLTIFGLLLTAQILGNYYFYVKNDGFVNQLSVNLILSVLMSLANSACQVIAKSATRWEGHKYKTTYHTSFFIKTWIFRMATTSILFCFSLITVVTSEGDNTLDDEHLKTLPPSDCSFERISQQYATTVFLMLLSTPLEYIIARVQKKLTQTRWYKSSSNSDNRFKYEFNWVEEIADLVFKQFIVLVGMFVWPAIVFVMVFVIWLELYYDRKKLINCSRPLVVTQNKFENLIFLTNLAYIVLGIVCFPNGLIFIWYARSHHCNFPML